MFRAMLFIVFVLHIPDKSQTIITEGHTLDANNITFFPLIRVCCPRNQILPDGECGDVLKNDLVGKKMSLKEGTTKLHKLNSDLMFESDWFGYCDEAYDLTDDKLIIFENETFGIQSQNWTISKDAFCLYANQFSSDFPKQIFLVLHKPCEYQNGQKVDLEQNVVAISLICNALTIAVYIFVYKKRNIINKCFMCYIACMSLHHLLWLLTRYGNLVKESCTSAGYARYFFASACILWLFVISHKIRVGLLSINKNEHRNLFALYNAIVWGISGMATTVIFLIDHFWGADLSSYKWTPAIGFFQCWFNPNDWSILIYYIGPILILNVVNWFMFVLTATQIFKVHRNVKKWIISNPKSDRNTYLRFVRIYVMMGVSWVLDLLPFFFRGNVFWQWVFWLAYYYHLALGVIIFVLFVLKRSTILLPLSMFNGCLFDTN